MSEKRKTPLEEEFEKHYSSEKGPWTNAWSPTWEDTMPLEALRFGAPEEDFPEESGFSAKPDEEESAP
jgi:hypothetical protein